MLQREKEEQARRQQQYQALVSTVQAEQKPFQLHNLEQQILLQQQSQLEKLGVRSQPPTAPQLESNDTTSENLYNQQISLPEQIQPYTNYAQHNQQNTTQPNLMSFGENIPPSNQNGIMDAFTP